MHERAATVIAIQGRLWGATEEEIKRVLGGDFRPLAAATDALFSRPDCY